MADLTFHERMQRIAALLEDATPGDWRSVPSERPTISTAVSEQWHPGDETFYGGFMGTGELAEFSKYPGNEVDADLVVELKNAAEEIVAAYKQYAEMVKLMKWLAPLELHGDVPAMIAWVKNRFDY